MIKLEQVSGDVLRYAMAVDTGLIVEIDGRPLQVFEADQRMLELTFQTMGSGVPIPPSEATPLSELLSKPYQGAQLSDFHRLMNQAYGGGRPSGGAVIETPGGFWLFLRRPTLWGGLLSGLLVPTNTRLFEPGFGPDRDYWNDTIGEGARLGADLREGDPLSLNFDLKLNVALQEYTQSIDELEQTELNLQNLEDALEGARFNRDTLVDQTLVAEEALDALIQKGDALDVWISDLNTAWINRKSSVQVWSNALKAFEANTARVWEGVPEWEASVQKLQATFDRLGIVTDPIDAIRLGSEERWRDFRRWATEVPRRSTIEPGNMSQSDYDLWKDLVAEAEAEKARLDEVARKRLARQKRLKEKARAARAEKRAAQLAAREARRDLRRAERRAERVDAREEAAREAARAARAARAEARRLARLAAKAEKAAEKEKAKALRRQQRKAERVVREQAAFAASMRAQISMKAQPAEMPAPRPHRLGAKTTFVSFKPGANGGDIILKESDERFQGRFRKTHDKSNGRVAALVFAGMQFVSKATDAYNVLKIMLQNISYELPSGSRVDARQIVGYAHGYHYGMEEDPRIATWVLWDAFNRYTAAGADVDFNWEKASRDILTYFVIQYAAGKAQSAASNYIQRKTSPAGGSLVRVTFKLDTVTNRLLFNGHPMVG